MTNNPQQVNSVFLVDVGKIKPNPMQPRREFDENRLNDLAESIRRYGILQPLVVTRKEIETDYGVNVEYELIAGERRLRAAKLASLPHVPVIIQNSIEDKIKLELAIIENLQREDLTPIDRAKAFKKLIEEFKLKHYEVGERVGKSREYVTNTVRLLGLPEMMQESLSRGEIMEGHCRPILMLTDRKEEQMQLFKDIIAKRISVREAEKISRKIAVERARRKDNLPDPAIRMLEEKLTTRLGTRVQIDGNGQRGRIYIDFSSNDELKDFLSKVLMEMEVEQVVSVMPDMSDMSEIPVNNGEIASVDEVNNEVDDGNEEKIDGEELNYNSILTSLVGNIAENSVEENEKQEAIEGSEPVESVEPADEETDDEEKIDEESEETEPESEDDLLEKPFIF